MEVLVYEFFLAGGASRSTQREGNASLLTEGAAMVASVANDLAHLDHVDPVVMLDRRLEGPDQIGLHQGCQLAWVDSEQHEQRIFEQLAATADWTIVVAPEWDDILLSRAQRCLAVGGRLLGPGPDLIRLAADKITLADYCKTQGLPVPFGCLLEQDDDLPLEFPYPAILKPRFGAGSAGRRWLENSTDKVVWAPRFAQYRLEQYCPGIAASVGLLMGPAGHYVLPPCRQHLSDDGTFQYQGGSLPMPASLAERAEVLAHQVADVLPAGVGYLGLDMVLGEEGTADFLIEVNSRLTTSYVGLSQLTEGNLAEMMLRVAEGESIRACFREEPVCFEASGRLLDTRVS